MTHRLLILDPRAARYRALLRARALPDLTVHACATLDRVADASACDLVLGRPDWIAAALDRLPRLAWAQSTFAGVEALCAAGLRRDYRLTAARGPFDALVAEYVFGWLLALERRLFDLRAAQAERRWEPLPYRSLQGQTLGVCGTGALGRAIARSGRHFGMTVKGYRRSMGAVEGFDETFSGARLDAFLQGLDVLVVALPLTPATVGLIDAAALARLPPAAVLVNVGRGRVVDEIALADALRRGAPRAAVVDVFADEPLPENHPLWGLSNCYVTPHTAATSFPGQVTEVFVDNYRRYVAGEALRYTVDFDRGY